MLLIFQPPHEYELFYTCRDQNKSQPRYDLLADKRLFTVYFLPPASEGWGKVIFSVCPHLQGGEGTPSQVWVRGIPHPRSGGYPVPGLGGGTPFQVCGGGTSSQFWGGVYPVPGLGGGYPIPGLDGEGYLGYPPGQVWMVGVPRVPPHHQD